VLDMTDSNSFIPSFSTIEHPRYPKCSVLRMSLARIAPGTGDFDIITFECSKCAHNLTISVEYDPMNRLKRVGSTAVSSNRVRGAPVPGIQLKRGLAQLAKIGHASLMTRL
jgi:hypothetical protein